MRMRVALRSMIFVPSPRQRALLVSLAALLLVEVFVIIPRPTAVVLVAAALWAALPGIALVRSIAGESNRGVAWVLGPALGIGFSVLGMLVVWVAGLQNWLTVLIGPALTWAIAWAMRKAGGLRVRWPIFDARDIVPIVIALAVVPLITWAPYDHVREPVPGGEAYRAYFTADFIWAMTVTARSPRATCRRSIRFCAARRDAALLLAGALPVGGRLPQRAGLGGLGRTGDPRQWTGVRDGVRRVHVRPGADGGATPAFAAAACHRRFCRQQLRGADMTPRVVAARCADRDDQEYNIDAVTRWFYQGMPVDGLQRLLLYQPHHLTGYVLALAALWLVGFAEDVSELGIARRRRHPARARVALQHVHRADRRWRRRAGVSVSVAAAAGVARHRAVRAARRRAGDCRRPGDHRARLHRSAVRA